MIVFRAFLQILARNKWIILMYSAILVVFSIFSLQTSQSAVTFEAIKPDLYLVNHDVDQGITHALVTYLSDQNNLVDLPEDSSDAVSDALFYRQINFYIEIPAGFRDEFLRGENPAIIIRSSGDYNASLAEMGLTRFLDLAHQYRLITPDEAALIKHLETTLATKVQVELTSTRDATSLDHAAYYYSFMNYPFLAGCIYVIAIIMLSFRNTNVFRRIVMGGLRPEHVNRILLGANSLFALGLWLLYVLVSFLVVGPTMFSLYGLCFILNSFVFTLSVTALAFLISSLLKSRNAINGVTNVVALGSSFLCGAFVPLTWLPTSVVAVAHLLPSYWYISANNQIASLESFTFDTLWPVFFHLLVVLAFTLVFALLANLLSHRQNR